MKLIPMGYRVAIKEDVADEKTEGGIFIPQQGREKPATGTVVAVGPGAMDKEGVFHTPSVAEGDRVIFQRNSGEEFDLDGEKVRIMSHNNIVAKLV